MNGKHVISLALLGLLALSLLDVAEACKKCGVNNCNCVGSGPQYSLGGGGAPGHQVAPLSYSPLYKPSLYRPHHQLFKPLHAGLGLGQHQQHRYGCPCRSGLAQAPAGYGYAAYGACGAGYPYGAGYGYSSGYGCGAGHGYAGGYGYPSYRYGVGNVYGLGQSLRRPLLRPRCRCF